MRRVQFRSRRPIQLFLLLFVLGWSLAAGQARNPLSYANLLDLARLGLEPSLISAQIEKLGLDFEPTPRQLVALREAGLSPDILALILRDAGLRTSSSAPVQTTRVFQQRREDGRVVLVLTNLDDQGNPIRDPAEQDAPPARPSAAQEPPERVPAQELNPASGTSAPPPLVVVNVQAPPPVPPMVAVPFVAMGGIVGAYQYPQHLPFLGYGQGISTPGWFSGLGLNAANNFGHRSQDKPNTTGLGAFFGPPSR